MSRRTLSKPSAEVNPAKKFLEWKSNEKTFSYYDKEKGENVLIKLPLKIQFLEDFHTIKGWNDASQSGIYSNEVQFISKEEMIVKAFKGGEIAKGLYKDIKLDIMQAGGKYHKSVYCVDESGEIINLQIKGAVVSAYSDFLDGHSNRLESFWIKIEKVEDKKKGATKFSVPVFEIGEGYTKDEMAQADKSYLEISEYWNNKVNPKNDIDDHSEDIKDEAEPLGDSLPF